MLTVEHPAPGMAEMTLTGPIGADDVRQAVEAFRRARAEAGVYDLLVVVEGAIGLTFAGLVEDLKHLPESLGSIPHAGRIALVAQPGWIATLARIESTLIPGFHLEVYRPEELAQARAWVRREQAAPR